MNKRNGKPETCFFVKLFGKFVDELNFLFGEQTVFVIHVAVLRALGEPLLVHGKTRRNGDCEQKNDQQ